MKESPMYSAVTIESELDFFKENYSQAVQAIEAFNEKTYTEKVVSIQSLEREIEHVTRADMKYKKYYKY